jgi:RNA polymerase I-specific transcription initiation factor RRN3
MVSIVSPAGAMPPPPTPYAKRPTIGLKRDSSYLDTDDEAGLSLTTVKKLRFSQEVDVRTIADDYSEKSFDLVKEEVRQGIEGHLAPGDRQDDKRYLGLVEMLATRPEAADAPSGSLLKKYLLAVDSKISLLGQCSQLVTVLLDQQWLGRDEAFVRQYTRLICSLGAAHTKFVPVMLEKLVEHFARLPASLGRIPGETPVPRALMFQRVHSAIVMLVQRMPSMTTTLLRVLKTSFPNDLATTRSYIQYQKHMLHLASYLPAVKAEIFALLTQRLVSIDEQIQLDIEDLEEEAEERLLEPRRISTSDDLDDSDDDSVSESEETMTDDEQRLRELRLKVAKLDGTMDMLFGYYTPLVLDGLKAEINDAFQQLLSHFATFVLPRRTRHAQFLIFHFSQMLPEHSSLFARQCLHAIFETGRSLSLRLHACAYLASFTARGAHLPSTIVREIFLGLCEELEAMRRRYEPGCRGPDKRSYSVYYAIAQAILYIFCFRWRDLVTGAAESVSGDGDASEEDILAEGRELAWLPNMKDILWKNMSSRLNPLKVCSPAIVSEFAKLANHVSLFSIFSILETNKRIRLGNAYVARSISDVGRRETAMDRKQGEAHLQLEAYFPFDPYALPLSKHWVDGDYNEWKLPAGMRQEGNEDDEHEVQSDDESLPEEDDLPLLDDGESVSSEA